MSLVPDFTDPRTLEKYSSAYTLSDMEIFVFPELFYPLVLANIMSPEIWEWRKDEWFKDIHKKSSNYKINRIKQYIMDHFVFNLDLETWGLTDKEKELERFRDYIDTEVLSKSNALFGYEGDKYYFDIDIRRHFGLDKYKTDIIPYWKTETVEAMKAFKYKKSFDRGAGECVSLSALYAAALFIVGGIPLESIFLMGTPLHSQNFIDISDGVLTNNRRIVTKKMWYNGTSISTMARRALEHEKVTIVSHITGYMHYMYDNATINKKDYLGFRDKLSAFLVSPLSPDLFINFLRYHMKFKKLFQYRYFMNARYYYIPLETIFEYEHSTKHILSADSSDQLINEIDDEEFSLTPIKSRIILQEITDYISKNGSIHIDSADFRELTGYCIEMGSGTKKITAEKVESLFRDLRAFLQVIPKLPDAGKNYIESEDLKISVSSSREEIIKYITDQASRQETALLSLYAYREMDKTDWKPFIKAALQRNPVSLEGLKGRKPDEAYLIIHSLPDESIYDSCRLAQPDEVWNFGRGDGIEKAFLLANYLYNELMMPELVLRAEDQRVVLESVYSSYEFTSSKRLNKVVSLALYSLSSNRQ